MVQSAPITIAVHMDIHVDPGRAVHSKQRLSIATKEPETKGHRKTESVESLEIHRIKCGSHSIDDTKSRGEERWSHPKDASQKGRDK